MPLPGSSRSPPSLFTINLTAAPLPSNLTTRFVRLVDTLFSPPLSLLLRAPSTYSDAGLLVSRSTKKFVPSFSHFLATRWLGGSVRYEQTITGSILTIGMPGTKLPSTCRPVSETFLFLSLRRKFLRSEVKRRKESSHTDEFPGESKLRSPPRTMLGDLFSDLLRTFSFLSLVSHFFPSAACTRARMAEQSSEREREREKEGRENEGRIRRMNALK